MKKPIGSKREQSVYIETAKQKVLEILFRYPDKEFSLSDLAKEAGVAKANIGKILEEFSKAGFIDIIKLSKIWRIKANLENPNFKINKMFYNLQIIYHSNLVSFLVNYFNNPKSIILFGSFRKGEDAHNSDVDIAIEKDDIKNYETHNLKEVVNKKLKKEIIKFEEDIGRKIQIHFFNKEHVDINVFNNIANGIVIFGFLEVGKP